MTATVRSIVGLAFIASASAALAQAPTESVAPQTPYSILNPVPESELRDLGTDRPDTTESYQSVDAGHLQVEMDFGVLSLDRGLSSSAPVALRGPAVNLKVGLTQAVDLQLVLPAPGIEIKGDTVSGSTGSVAARLKVNLLGNDGGFFGIALMPWVDVDVASSEVVAGLIVPLGFNLADDMWLVAMGQLDAVPTGTGYTAEVLASASLGRELVGPLAGYIETFVTVQPTAPQGAAWTGSGGLTFALNDATQLDAGTRIDILAPKPTAEFFVGFSIRR